MKRALLVALLASPGCRPSAAPVPQVPVLGRVRQLTFEGRRSGEAYFGPHGRLVFQSERHADNPFYQIYSMDLGTGRTQRLSPGTGKSTCGWLHPSGTRALFASTHAAPDAAAEEARERAE